MLLCLLSDWFTMLQNSSIKNNIADDNDSSFLNEMLLAAGNNNADDNESSFLNEMLLAAGNHTDIFDMSGYDFYLDAGFLSEQFSDESLLDLSALSIVSIVLYSLVFIVGLLGNVLVIVVIIKFKSMRTLTNVFLVNLTIGDILVILICVPLTLAGQIYRKWIFGDVLCKLTPFIQGTAIGVSVLSLLTISISRYYAIYKPLKAKIVFSKKNVRILIVLIWVVSITCFSPLLYVSSVTTYGVPGIFVNKICEEKWDSIGGDKNIYNLFIFSVLFVFPFVVMGTTYTVIGYTLWHGNAMLFNNNAITQAYKKTHLILRQRRRTVKMLICVVTIFGVSWLPYYCINIWIDFNIGQYNVSDGVMAIISSYVYPLVLLLGLSNSAVNPICYCFLSHGFRRGFNKIFCLRLRRRRRSSYLLSSIRKYSQSESIETADM